MPRISEFYEPPHFHAVYGEFQAIVHIDSLEALEGYLPNRAMKLTTEWASGHKSELVENWRRARKHRSLLKVAPLE